MILFCRIFKIIDFNYNSWAKKWELCSRIGVGDKEKQFNNVDTAEKDFGEWGSLDIHYEIFHNKKLFQNRDCDYH